MRVILPRISLVWQLTIAAEIQYFNTEGGEATIKLMGDNHLTRRGKPLYLSRDRYQLLEQQWLAHRFDHTKKTWVQHRNAL